MLLYQQSFSNIRGVGRLLRTQVFDEETVSIQGVGSGAFISEPQIHRPQTGSRKAADDSGAGRASVGAGLCVRLRPDLRSRRWRRKAAS
ncbi:hypothetical protein GCM10009687_35050 [Asanoa iriomotensis]